MQRLSGHVHGERGVDAYLKGAMAENIIDQQVRAVDIGKSNVAIGMVYRGKLTSRAEGGRARLRERGLPHHQRLGDAGDRTRLSARKRRPATNTNVRILNGPGNNAKSIQERRNAQLKAGDVDCDSRRHRPLFTKIDDHIAYLMVRVDPDKVAPLKDEAASKADLAQKK